jgi:c-di-GMP-binding flagellar brake protein YcgR
MAQGNGSEPALALRRNDRRQQEEQLPNVPDAVMAGRQNVKTAQRERREWRREKITLPAKLFVPSTEIEIDCIVTDLSPGGAGIDATIIPAVGTEVVLYVEGFDRFSGSVARVSSDGVGIKFNCSQHKQARTAEKIYCYLIGEALPKTAARSARRAALPSARELRRENGETAGFDVIDISLTGAALRTRSRPAIGEVVTIGTVKGHVVRYIDAGFAVEFARPTPGKDLAAR